MHRTYYCGNIIQLNHQILQLHLCNSFPVMNRPYSVIRPSRKVQNSVVLYLQRHVIKTVRPSYSNFNGLQFLKESSANCLARVQHNAWLNISRNLCVDAHVISINMIHCCSVAMVMKKSLTPKNLFLKVLEYFV